MEKKTHCVCIYVFFVGGGEKEAEIVKRLRNNDEFPSNGDNGITALFFFFANPAMIFLLQEFADYLPLVDVSSE